ncbi:hypothetical protein J3R83DRAFT_12688 [Lanmaoa asiatica]|nr:hypothetical protein J3R83DRAFT_12688 [Lanmaoa asiatica]
MSLTTFLLGTKPSGRKKVIDTELDTLFNLKTLGDRPESTSSDHPIAKKEKRSSDVHPDEPGSKRSKRSLANAASLSVSPPGKQKKSGKNRVRGTPEHVLEPGSSDAGKPESSRSGSSNESGLESSDEDGNHPSTLIHETQQDKPGKQASRKERYAPSDETKERRDARTIFIGNLAPDVAIKRVSERKILLTFSLTTPSRQTLQKQLHRHILAFLPTAKVESTRFRSVAFQSPTSKLPEASDDVKKNKQPREHERDRASSWRDAHAADESKTNEKKFLTPSQKKKIAFINRDIHSEADSVHAYIVFAYPPPPHSRPGNLPPLPPVMDPFEAARLAIEKCSGTMFLDRTLRVDTVVKRSTTEGLSHSTLLSSVIGDPKLTVFVGNLDFSSKEEDLRVFFEGIVSAERGLPDAQGSQDGDKPKCCVTRVRMIRDKDTQLGKGFAYVQFSTSCPAPVPPVPKGDPSLGEKLVKLTKEERKRVKAADADRVARRMAKKRSRMALAKQGVPPQNKQRERVRKAGATKKLGGTPPKKTTKGRVRSEKSITKRNTKK